jgi:hypothetical protein
VTISGTTREWAVALRAGATQLEEAAGEIARGARASDAIQQALCAPPPIVGEAIRVAWSEATGYTTRTKWDDIPTCACAYLRYAARIARRRAATYERMGGM